MKKLKNGTDDVYRETSLKISFWLNAISARPLDRIDGLDLIWSVSSQFWREVSFNCDEIFFEMSMLRVFDRCKVTVYRDKN